MAWQAYLILVLMEVFIDYDNVKNIWNSYLNLTKISITLKMLAGYVLTINFEAIFFKMDNNTQGFITATHLLEYLYCPRFIYFENVLDLPEHQEQKFKVQKGREIHKKIKKMNPDYLKKNLGNWQVDITGIWDGEMSWGVQEII